MNFDTSALISLQGQQAQSTLSALNETPKDKTKKTASDFETMVMSQLLQPMFEGLKSDGMFGGGEGEEAFKSFYVGAMAKQITMSGGVGISATVQRELLKMQGAS